MGRIHQNVQTTASNVQTLGERSREINNVVEVISNIAHQTNRLALDAAIQAAMAGENGKGFGAVAADIRRLAERAKEQTSIIARIVRGVRDDIGAVAISMQDTERETSTGARLTQNAGTALESIFTAVERQAQEIEGINAVTRQQLETSSAIVQIMHNVSNTTQQSTVSTRDTSQSTERLARLVEQLRASVEAFKLPEEQRYFGQMPNVNIIPASKPDEQLSISGAYRTVTAFQPNNRMPDSNMLPAGRPPVDPFSFYPLAPNPDGNGNGGGGLTRGNRNHSHSHNNGLYPRNSRNGTINITRMHTIGTAKTAKLYIEGEMWDAIPSDKCHLVLIYNYFLMDSIHNPYRFSWTFFTSACYP